MSILSDIKILSVSSQGDQRLLFNCDHLRSLDVRVIDLLHAEIKQLRGITIVGFKNFTSLPEDYVIGQALVSVLFSQAEMLAPAIHLTLDNLVKGYVQTFLAPFKDKSRLSLTIAGEKTTAKMMSTLFFYFNQLPTLVSLKFRTVNFEVMDVICKAYPWDAKIKKVSFHNMQTNTGNLFFSFIHQATEIQKTDILARTNFANMFGNKAEVTAQVRQLNAAPVQPTTQDLSLQINTASAASAASAPSGFDYQPSTFSSNEELLSPPLHPGAQRGISTASIAERLTQSQNYSQMVQYCQRLTFENGELQKKLAIENQQKVFVENINQQLSQTVTMLESQISQLQAEKIALAERQRQLPAASPIFSSLSSGVPDTSMDFLSGSPVAAAYPSSSDGLLSADLQPLSEVLSAEPTLMTHASLYGLRSSPPAFDDLPQATNPSASSMNFN